VTGLVKVLAPELITGLMTRTDNRTIASGLVRGLATVLMIGQDRTGCRTRGLVTVLVAEQDW
jgi:hypothetical protein